MRNILILSFFLYSITCQVMFPQVESGLYRWKDLPLKIIKDLGSRKLDEVVSILLEYLETHTTTNTTMQSYPQCLLKYF